MESCDHSGVPFEALAACETCGEAMCFECSQMNHHTHYRDVHKWCEREDVGND